MIEGMLYSEMDLRDLREKAKGLEREARKLETWRIILSSEHGQFILSELKQKLDTIRSEYSTLPASGNAGAFLSWCQGREKEIKALVDSLENIEKRKQDIDSEVDYIVQLLQSRPKNQEARTSFLPLELKEQKDGRE